MRINDPIYNRNIFENIKAVRTGDVMAIWLNLPLEYLRRHRNRMTCSTGHSAMFELHMQL